MSWKVEFVGEPGKQRPIWVNNDPLDKWWICSECGADKINVQSQDGCVCPKGHGGLTPGLVTTAREPSRRAVNADVAMVIPNSLECGGKGFHQRHYKKDQRTGKCGEAAIISVGPLALCWDCSLTRNVDPKSVLGPDWRNKINGGA